MSRDPSEFHRPPAVPEPVEGLNGLKEDILARWLFRVLDRLDGGLVVGEDIAFAGSVGS